ncbi:MAG: signal peptidase II [Deltaproteobacteria bacterium]|nr:signal peptidase II [Deltaproteobacteria bacterium]MBI3389143.1 signal peptidase II [Deltaproteobacteria bacterium]
MSTIGCDQATKHLARSHLAGLPPRSFLGGFVRIALAENEGGFLSLGSSLPPALRATVFFLDVAAVLALAAVYLVRPAGLRFSVLLCAWGIWAGGLSNFLDRILFEGRVTDFMIVGLGPLHTGVFNVADVAIVAGGVFLALSAWRVHPTGPGPDGVHEGNSERSIE